MKLGMTPERYLGILKQLKAQYPEMKEEPLLDELKGGIGEEAPSSEESPAPADEEGSEAPADGEEAADEPAPIVGGASDSAKDKSEMDEEAASAIDTTGLFSSFGASGKNEMEGAEEMAPDEKDDMLNEFSPKHAAAKEKFKKLRKAKGY